MPDGDGTPRPHGARLVLCDGEFAGSEHPLAAEETLIGRNPTTDITLLDESISREHAIVAWDAESGVFTIEDLQSTNGTRVNGKRVRSAVLGDGDEIQVGHTRFRLLVPERGASARGAGFRSG
jgi:pSer/pThr/pTyr-binding forkhead associated (FHA) protein